MIAAIHDFVSRPLRLHVVLIGLLATALLGGCATGRPSKLDLTGGVSLQMFIKAPGNSFTLYQVETDGTLSFGGGTDAANGKTSWTGILTDDERRQLLGLIDRSGWWIGEPALSVGGDEPKRTIEIKLAGPRGRRSFKLVDAVPGADVLAVEELLAQAARRRNENFLNTLPKPGEQR